MQKMPKIAICNRTNSQTILRSRNPFHHFLQNYLKQCERGDVQQDSKERVLDTSNLISTFSLIHLYSSPLNPVGETDELQETCKIFLEIKQYVATE